MPMREETTRANVTAADAHRRRHALRMPIFLTRPAESARNGLG